MNLTVSSLRQGRQVVTHLVFWPWLSALCLLIHKDVTQLHREQAVTSAEAGVP